MTSREINYSNGADIGDGISGFYYDSQLNLETMSASLHPNTVFNGGSRTWEKVPEDEQEPKDNNIDADHSKVSIHKTDITGKAKEIYYYRERPICRAILNEEFQVSVANQFTGFGEDFVGQLWSNLKPLAPYARDVGKLLGNIADQTEKFFQDKEDNMGAMKDLKDKFIETLRGGKDVMGQAEDYLNRSLVVQGSRFSYYNGTGIDFGNLSMKFTIFSGFHTVNEYGEKPSGSPADSPRPVVRNIVYNSVYNQVAEILPYVIGEFIPVTEIAQNAKNETMKSFGQSVSEFASWQLPPGGYKPDYMDVDVVHPGTLKLRLGPYFSLENLVIKSAQFTYSKAMSKNPTYKVTDDKITRDGVNYLVPLSCEVLLNLSPITLYSRQSLERYMSGSSSRGSIKAIVDKMDRSLSDIKQRTDDISKIKRI